VNKGNACIVIAMAVMASVVLLLREFAARSLFAMILFDHISPLLISDASIVRNFNSPDKDMVYSSVSVLEDHNSRSGMEKAKELMHSNEGWIHGAMYLGHFGDASSIPYLIKGLRDHNASGLYKEVSEDLEQLTGQRYGTDFQKWRDWWQQAHPGEHFDFDSNLNG